MIFTGDWHHCSMAMPAGKYASTEQIPPVSLISAACGMWFILEVNNFTMDDKFASWQRDLCQMVFVDGPLHSLASKRRTQMAKQSHILGLQHNCCSNSNMFWKLLRT